MKIVMIYQAPFEQTAMGFQSNADYEQVWLELDDSPDVDEIWQRFNIDHPTGYAARSLSIGDVVAIEDEMFTPEPVGWRKLTPEERICVLASAVERIKVRDV